MLVACFIQDVCMQWYKPVHALDQEDHNRTKTVSRRKVPTQNQIALHLQYR